MNKKLAVTVSLLMILCFSLAGQALAQSALPGVEAGDSFVYSINTYWTSTNSSRTVPEYLVLNNQTKWFNVSVSQVLGANVSATNSWEYNNGTRGDSLVQMEVANGTVFFAIEGLPAFTGFYPANLNANDLIRPLATDGPRINETISREYASGNRDTNVLTFSYEVTDNTNSSIGNETVTNHIDRATGVLIEQIIYTEFPDQTGSIEWKLTSTNVWNVSAQPMSWLEIIAIVVVAIIVVAVVAVYIINRRRHRH